MKFRTSHFPFFLKKQILALRFSAKRYKKNSFRLFFPSSNPIIFPFFFCISSFSHTATRFPPRRRVKNKKKKAAGWCVLNSTRAANVCPFSWCACIRSFRLFAAQTCERTFRDFCAFLLHFTMFYSKPTASRGYILHSYIALQHSVPLSLLTCLTVCFDFALFVFGLFFSSVFSPGCSVKWNPCHEKRAPAT